jgi:hypothetical protein
MSQTLSIKENDLAVFVSPGIYHAICLEIYHVGKNIEKVIVSRNLHQTHLLEVGMMQIPVDHTPLSIVRHVGPHVDFSSTNFSLGL